MKKNDYVKAGRLLCYVLRHDPQYFDLEMDTQGWVKTTSLISAINASDKKLKFKLTLELLLDIAEQDKQNDKDRYEFKNYNEYIRAKQGHSLPFVKIDFEDFVSTDDVYHGTSPDNLESIFKQGIVSKKRNIVHLSTDIETAFTVGRRHSRKNGKVAIIVIDNKPELNLKISANGVVLADHIPVKYFKGVLYKNIE